MFPKFSNPIEVHSIHELGLGAIFGILFWPTAFILYCLNMTLRFISQLLCDYYYPGRYKIADGEDSVFGVQLQGSSKSYIYGYKIIRGKPDIDVIRSKVGSIFTATTGYERLKHAMTHKFGFFHWDTSVHFDVTKNVRFLDDLDPDEIVDETRLTELCSNLVGTTCGDDRPQWEILLIPKYRRENELLNTAKQTNHYALIIRIHHAYCDGISFVLLVNNFLADSPGELPIDPMKGFDNPVWIKAYIWAKILIVGPLNFFRNLAMMIITPHNFRVDRYVNRKILARSSSLDMDIIKKIRTASGTSVTSITLAAVYGAVYKTYQRLFPKTPVPKYMQMGTIGVMLPYSEEKRLSNQFTMWRYVAPMEVEDPVRRLLMAHEEVRRNASQPDPVFNYYMQRALGSLPKIWHEILFSLSGTPVMLSNVPGYKTSVKAFGGEVVDVAAWIPLLTTCGVGVSSQSYCGEMHFSAIADPQLFQNATECKKFLDAIVEEIYIMAKEYGVQFNRNNFGNATNFDCERADQFKLPLFKRPQKDVNANEEEIIGRESPKAYLNPLHLPQERIHRRTLHL